MRIVIAQRLTLAHGIGGGMETQAHTLATGLAARGHSVVILTTPHPDGRKQGEEQGIPVRYVAPGSYRSYHQRWYAACYRELAALHQQTPFDILFSQSAGALGYIARAYSELKLPGVVLLHGTFTSELNTRLRGAGSVRGLYRLARFGIQAIQQFLAWRSARHTVAHWIAVSTVTASNWRFELGVPAEQITVIHNGVDINRFRPDPAARMLVRQARDLAPDIPVLLAAGRLEWEKGFQIAIQAMRTILPHIPQARMLIAGEGSYRAQLEHEARDLRDAVLFTGHVPNAELHTLMAAADLFLMPTICNEGLPIVILEALASGLPVIASNVGGIPDAIINGRTGILAPMGDSTAWAAAITTLLSNQQQYQAIGALAHQDAIKRFSRDHMIEATEAVLLRIAN